MFELMMCSVLVLCAALLKEALTHGNKSTPSKTKVLFQRRPVFVSFPVTKPVVTQGTTRHQMKDMDIIFPLIPCELLQVKWSDHNSPAKSVIFPRNSKLLKNGLFSLALKP